MRSWLRLTVPSMLLMLGCAAPHAPRPASAPESAPDSAPAAPQQRPAGEPMPTDSLTEGETKREKKPTSADTELGSLDDAEEALEEAITLFDETVDGQPTELSRGGGCPRACKAVASMRRAADAICRLSADDDGRCTAARERVARSEERLARAACGC